MKDKHKPIGMVLVMPFQAQVAIFDNFKSRQKYYKKVLKIETDCEGFACASYDRIGNGPWWFSICIPEHCNIGTIIHECSHMVDFMFETHGVPGGIESTEIRAYMLSLLVLDVCEILNVFGAAQFQ